MKLVIIYAIRFYQRFAPSTIRARCVFAESCSQHVLNGARSGGTTEAIKRLHFRIKACRHGYRRLRPVPHDQNEPDLLLLVDGSVLELADVSERVRKELRLGNSDLFERPAR